MEEQNDRATPQANPGYGLFQIAKALTTSKEHPDAPTRSRALGKIEKWLHVLSGMFSGELAVGSRTPVAGTPAWVTLEVATGGFATGNKLANGPLQDHERTLLAHLKATAGDEADARLLLNSYYISDEGLAGLHEELRSGRYDVAIPEEGALLVVAWLVQNGHLDVARGLLETLAPHFAELRFYPVPTDRARTFGPQVSVRNVGETIDALTSLQPNKYILAQRKRFRSGRRSMTGWSRCSWKRSKESRLRLHATRPARESSRFRTVASRSSADGRASDIPKAGAHGRRNSSAKSSVSEENISCAAASSVARILFASFRNLCGAASRARNP
jgi:hypothetical protein